MPTRSLRGARARFGELVDDALGGVPQRVSRRGKDAVDSISAAAYDELTSPNETLVEFFARSPHREIDLLVNRSKETIVRDAARLR